MRRSRKFSSSCTPSAAREIRWCSRATWFRFQTADKGSFDERRQHQGSREGEVRKRGAAGRSGREFVLRGIAGGDILRPDYLKPVRRDAGGANSGGSVGGFAR